MKALRRFESFAVEPDKVQAMVPSDPAAVEGRTRFPSTVVAPEDSPRLLVSGQNHRKLGHRATKGPWRGIPIYALTLEERATCPRTCHHWLDCYGNAMHWSRRHKHGDALVARLRDEVEVLHKKHGRLAVRLHVLGDFYSQGYAREWLWMLNDYAGLHLFGFTAHHERSPVGDVVNAMNHLFEGRCAIRFSHTVSGPGRAITIDQKARGKIDAGIVCPAQTGDTECCATCGLCWAPAAHDETIVFIRHGRKKNGRSGRD